MRIKYLSFLVLLLWGLGSCDKVDNISELAPSVEASLFSTDFKVFSSSEDLKGYIHNSSEADNLTRSEGYEFHSMCSDIPISIVKSDPILSVEIPDSLRTRKNCNSVNLYTDFGYESLLPEEAFAAVLNFRGEYAVGDTVYKVSPRGTFCMPRNLLGAFENEYAKIYTATASAMTDGFYNFSDVSYLSEELRTNLRLYDTFNNAVQVIEISNEYLDNDNMINTRSSTLPAENPDDNWIEALDIDWDSFESHVTDAHTVAGKWIQSLFGRNKAFEVSFKDNRRLKTKLYYYNYLGYASIGAKTKFQKKNVVGWSGKNADHLYLIWNNMVLKSKLPFAVEYPHTFIPTTRMYIGSNIETIPGTNKKGTVHYYVGKPLSDSELKSLATDNYMDAVIKLKMQVDKDFGKNLTRVGAIKYICDNVVWTVIRPYGKHGSNVEKLSCDFESDFHISIGLKNFVPGVDYTIKEWLKMISAQTFESPQLVQGEIRTAAIKNGETKGLRLIKK